MGNLTNPVSLRIKSNLYWNSIWVSYIHSNYSYLLSTDYLLYSYLNWFISRKIFSNFGWLYFYSHYKLVRVCNFVYIIFFFKDYKFYRFIFEYLSLILKIVSKKRTRFFIGARFNWYKLKKSIYKTYFSRKFLTYFKVKNKLKINFLYYTCWLYTFYLIQQKYVSTRIVKKKYLDMRFSSNTTTSNIFFFNIFKLNNFLNLFYFVILLYLKKIKHLNLLTVCYSYYLFFRQHKDFYFFWIFYRRCIYFFKSDNNTDIILFSEFNKRSPLKKRIYVFKRVVAKIPETFRFIYKKKIVILFNTSSVTKLFHNFCKLKKRVKHAGNNNIFKLRKPTNIKYCFNYFKNPHSANVQIRQMEHKNNLLLDLFKCFEFNLSAYSKYTKVKKKIFFSNMFLAPQQYNTHWNFAQRFFRHWSMTLLGLKYNVSLMRLKQSRLVYLKKYNIFRRMWIQLLKQWSKATRKRRLSKKQKLLYRRIIANQKLRTVRVRRKFKAKNRAVIDLQKKIFMSSSSLFFSKLFDLITIDITAFDFFLQYSSSVKNLYNKKKSKYLSKFLLLKILFKIIKNTKYFIYFYYFKLYYYFYYFKFYVQLNTYFSANLTLLRKLLYLYKKLTLKKITKTKLKTYTFLLNTNITEIKDKNAFKLKYYLTKKQSDKNFGKLFNNIRFKLKNLLVYRKLLFTKYTFTYKKYVLSWKYNKYLKYRFIYYLLYPIMTFKRILNKYTKLRQIRIGVKTFRYVFKKNLKFFFKKYVIANKLNLVKPIIFNTNIFLFYKNILRNLLIIVQLRQSKNYLFTFKHLYYRFLCKFFILKRLDKKIAITFLKSNPYRTLCLDYVRKFCMSLNNIYSINSNIFLTNFVKKLKNLFNFFGHKTFNIKLIFSCLREIHINFFNFFNFFIVNLVEISKYRLYFSKYIYLFINTITKKKEKITTSKISIKQFNRVFIKKKYIVASIFALPNKVTLLKKFYYISKIRYISNFLTKRKNLLKFKINTNILQNLQLRLPVKANTNFFFKSYGFFYKHNLIFNPLTVKSNKRVLNVFLYLNKFFVKSNFVTSYKIFRFFYKNLLNLKTNFCISDLKLILYFCYWKKQKKNEQDILWLRQQLMYPLILNVKYLFKFIEGKISYLGLPGYISIFFQQLNVKSTSNMSRQKIVCAGTNIFAANLLNSCNILFVFNKLSCVFLYYKWCSQQIVLLKFNKFCNVFYLIFKKTLLKKNNNVFFDLSLCFICNVFLKKHYYIILYWYKMFTVLFKRIFYLFTYTNAMSNTFFAAGRYTFFKQRLKKVYSLNYRLYYKNIYWKNQKKNKLIKQSLAQRIYFSNISICFLQYKIVGSLYKKNKWFFLKKKIIKNKKKKKLQLKKYANFVRGSKVKTVSVLNRFLTKRSINFQKKRFNIYLKTLHRCFDINAKYLKTLVQKKLKLALKTQKNTKKIKKSKNNKTKKPKNKQIIKKKKINVFKNKK